MAHFQLYFPGAQHLAPNPLARAGLDGLVRPGDRRPTLRAGAGPDGTTGTFLVWQPNDSPGCRPTRQTWLPAKRDDRRGLGAGRFWIGFDDRSPMTAEDLRRDEPAFQGGTPATLGDGRKWTVPFLHWIFFRAKSDAGDRHAWQVVSATAALDKARARGDDETIFRDSMDLCAELLAFNYRVTPGVCSRLGLLEPRSVETVLMASLRAPRISPNLSLATCASRASE
jgi:hypothetical protein